VALSSTSPTRPSASGLPLLVPGGGTLLPELRLEGDVVFVLGSERDGLPEDVLACCEARASISHTGGVESLNVAMAGTIALYELSRRRDQPSGAVS
jgi:tRNA G18 (ribose-2'-O)-methylase SpoU